MAKRQADTKDRAVESNAIARARLSPPADSVWEERIIAQVAAFNRAEDTEFPTTAFMIGQLFDTKKKLDGSRFKEVEASAKKLGSTTFTVYKSRDKFTVYPVFEFIDYDHGIITAKLNQGLKPHYLMLKQQFAVRSLPEFRKLSSVYSQQIYRFLNSWAKLNEATIPLEELIHATNPPPSIRDNYKNFKLRVLDISHREINEKTNLKYDWEPVKDGKKVMAVRFIFGKNAE